MHKGRVPLRDAAVMSLVSRMAPARFLAAFFLLSEIDHFYLGEIFFGLCRFALLGLRLRKPRNVAQWWGFFIWRLLSFR